MPTTTALRLYTLRPNSTSTATAGPTTEPIYLYAFTLIAFLICIIACGSAWRGVVIHRRRRELGLPELAEWRMGDHDAFGRLRKQEPVDPPVMYEVYLEDGRAEGRRWYWGQEKGRLDDDVWSNRMPISTSMVPVTDQSATSPEPEADPTLGVTVFSALTELPPHRWKIFNAYEPAAKNPLLPLVTSILIAMPAPHHSQSERQPLAAMSEGTLVFEDEFPEVLSRVYEGAWAQHQPTASSSRPPLGNDAASLV